MQNESEVQRANPFLDLVELDYVRVCLSGLPLGVSIAARRCVASPSVARSLAVESPKDRRAVERDVFGSLIIYKRRRTD